MADRQKEEEKGKIARKSELKDAPHDKDNLDEGLEESMDGSDPPSATQP